DVAADARSLPLQRRFSRQDCIERGSQILPRHRFAVPRPAGIKLTAVDELPLFVEQEKVRRAGGSISLGHFLRLVVKIGEGVRPSTLISEKSVAFVASGFIVLAVLTMSHPCFLI